MSNTDAVGNGEPDISIEVTPPGSLASLAQKAGLRFSGKWFERHALPDGSTFLRWKDNFDFVISPDGSVITAEIDPRVTIESFETYALGHVLSFAFLKRGVESLHATVVERNGRAIAILGDCGYGKSTLAATLVAAGFRLLTDDLLVLKDRDGKLMVQPGPARLKLVDDAAKQILGDASGAPMLQNAGKRLYSVPQLSRCSTPTPIERVYVLSRPQNRATGVRLRKLNATEAFRELTRNAFNIVVTERERIARHFTVTAEMAKKLSVKRLSYPRKFDVLPSVVDAILADLEESSVKRQGSRAARPLNSAGQ